MSEESVDTQILQELQKIREALAKPAPPAPQQTPPRGLIDEFVQFLNKYDVMGLAIAFIMGNAVSSLVSALVKDIIMLVITFFIPEGEWQTYILRLGPIQLLVGHFAGALLDFLIISRAHEGILELGEKNDGGCPYLTLAYRVQPVPR